MPYRVEIPEDRVALDHILNHLGSPLLVQNRQRTFRLVYDAPETKLSPREREAMRYPLTRMMGCAICNSMRMWRDWPGFSDTPIEEAFYENAESLNLNWSGFSERERLLLEFVDRFANAVEGMNADDAFWARISAAFSQEEIGDIINLAGIWLGVGFGLKALGIGSVCETPASQETYDKLRNAELDVSY